MQKYIFLLLLAVLGCSGCEGRKAASEPAWEPAHWPDVEGFVLSAEEVDYMEGAGKVTVTAEIAYRDAGEDIETLIIEMSNGDKLFINVSHLIAGQTGWITQQFDVATTETGWLDIELWFVDSASDTGARMDNRILIMGNVHTWVERAAGLPAVLNDVTGWGHDQLGFVAVGDAGTILTSDDGITWTQQVSGTTVDLNSVFCGWWIGCFVTGDEGTILQGGGEDWELYYDGPDDVSFTAFYGNPFTPMMIAAGHVVTTDKACILQREHDSDPWTTVEPLAQSGQHITDLKVTYDVNFGWEFVATVEVPFPDQGKVLVSADGLNWVEVFVSAAHASTYSILGHDDLLWVGASGGHIYSSPDGVNWTQHDTPAVSSNFVAMTAHDDELIALGFSETIGLGAQVGVVTSDGGQTWQEFVIGNGYESRGIADANGRWVSVGQLLSDPGKGAIYTTP